MNFLEIERLDGTIRFTLHPKKVNFFIKATLFVIAVTTITVPFTILFSDEVGKLAILGAILCGFLSVFILRMFLWNAFGKEVFEISEHKIFHYIDYQAFKDKLLLTEDLNNIHFGYENDHLSNGNARLLDSQEENEHEEYLFIISNKKGELTKANVKLSLSKVQEMIKALEE